MVAPNTWTKVEWDLSTLAPEGPPSFYTQTLTNVGHVQVGFNVPASMANSATSYAYGLDQVTVSNVPEPSCVLLMAGAIGMALAVRRSRD
jgi:hypothetical protein